MGGRCVNALTDSTVLVHLKPLNPLTEAGQIRRLLFVTKWWLCVKPSAAQTEFTSGCPSRRQLKRMHSGQIQKRLKTGRAEGTDIATSFGLCKLSKKLSRCLDQLVATANSFVILSCWPLIVVTLVTPAILISTQLISHFNSSPLVAKFLCSFFLTDKCTSWGFSFLPSPEWPVHSFCALMNDN